MDIFCRNSGRTINNTINCTVIYASQYFGDSIVFEEEFYNHSNNSLSHFGSDFGKIDIDEQKTNENIGHYLLSNTEFKFDADLTGFEVMAAKIGYISISVSSFFLKDKKCLFSINQI